ncbi:MAG: pitrilysin family protein [Bdellovibrio sp.]
MIFLSFLLLLSPVWSQSSDLRIDFPVERFELKNGLQVLLAPNSSVPLVSYQTWYRVGSRDEVPGSTGAAHMLEHMMFKGAKKYSGKQFWQLIQNNGISTNAFTSHDYTGFFLNAPSDKLELVMDLELDRMRFLELNPQELTSELQVVAEERRMRVDNSPVSLLLETLMGRVYQSHPYRWPVIGWMQDIQSYTVEKLRPFYDQFYVPNNAVLVLSGDFNPREIRQKIESRYGVLKFQPLPERKYSQEPDRPAGRDEILQRQVQSETFILMAKTTGITTPEAMRLQVLSSILSNASSSRLYRRLVYREKQASFVTTFLMNQQDPAAFVVGVGLLPGLTHYRSRQLVLSEIQALRPQTLSEPELERAKNMLMTRSLEPLRSFEGRARSLAFYEIVYGDYRRLFQELELLRKIRVFDIKEVAQKYLSPERLQFGLLKPVEGSTKQEKRL